MRSAAYDRKGMTLMSENRNDLKNQGENSSGAEIVGFKRAVPIILFAVAAFVELCFITQNTGVLGRFIGTALLGLFSYAAYAIPLLLFVHALFYYRDVGNKCVLSRAVFSVIAILAFSAFAYTLSSFGEETVFSASEFYKNGTECIGGGFIGSSLSFLLMKVFGSVGMIIIAVTVFALYVSFFFAKSKRASGKFLYFLLSLIVSAIALVEKGIKKVIGALKSIKTKKEEEIRRSKDEELFADSFFEVDNGMQELNIPKLGIKETRTNELLEANPTLHDRVYHKSEVEESEYVSKTAEEPIFSEPNDQPQRKKIIDFSYGATGASLRESEESRTAKEEDYIVIEEHPSDARTDEKSANRLYRLDENATDVFTKDFNPYDFAMNERLASKASTVSSSKIGQDRRGITEIEEPITRRSIDDITEEEIENARRLYDIQMKREAAVADFERKKKEALERMRHQATPVTNSTEQTGEQKRVEFNVFYDGAKTRETESVYHTTYEKSEPSMKAEGYDSLLCKKEDIESVGQSYTEPAYTEPSVTAAEQMQKADFALTADTPNAEEEAAFGGSEDGEYDAPKEATGEGEVNEYAFGEAAEDSAVGEAVEVTEESSIFAPISDAEVNAADFKSDLFTPFSQVTEATDGTTESDGAFLRTERSMINPIFDADEEEDLDEEEIAEDFAQADEEESAPAPEIIPPAERNPEVAAMRAAFPFLDEIPAQEPIEDDREEEEPPFVPTPSPKVQAPEKKPEPKKEEKPKPDFSSYEAPPIDILTRGEKSTESSEEEIQENANRLIETLASFNVTVSIKGVDRGPRITRYEVVPGPGVKVTQVTNLENDIKLNLAAEGMRIKAPIPGKAAIGIEIPNKKSEIVRLRDLIETEEYQTAQSKTFFCVGKDVAGYPVFNDIEKMPHMLVAGATGMGKSVFINSLMISLLYKARPDEVRFIMIDPKKLEFNMYNGIPHLLVPVVTEAKQAAGALMWAVEQMEKRYELMGSINVRNITGYNEKVKKNPELGEPLTRIIIVIDEFADLMLQVKNPVENLVMSIAQKARAAGIHLIIGTQRPSVNVLTGVIKANIPSRFTCKVVSNVDSRTIIEQAGAEKLLSRGDMLYMIPGMSEPERVQSAYVSDSEVEEIMDFLKSHSNGANYDNDVLEEINRQAAKCSKDGDGDDRDDRGGSESGEGYLNDRQFLDAVEVAVNTGKISTSLLQRKMSIGFGKAAKFIDIMEDLGVVSGPNGQKPRDVLLSPDEWHEKLARTELD